MRRMEGEMTHLISQVRGKLHTARVTHAHGWSDVLHVVTSVKQRNRDRNDERRQSLQRVCNKKTRDVKEEARASGSSPQYQGT